MNISNYRSLWTEIFKTLNDINPTFIRVIFKLRMTNRTTRDKYKLKLEIPKSNQVRFWTKRNSLPFHIKSLENLNIFKTLIKY